MLLDRPGVFPESLFLVRDINLHERFKGHGQVCCLLKKEWQLRKKQLREGEITKEEYLEWKLNWPQTADGCGRYEPKKKWRKE